LALVTLAVYWPVIHCDFVNFDDPFYVTDNSHVAKGLTWDSARWSLTGKPEGNWHPLTWISHMLDCSVYGLKPAGHHATNLLFHMANSVLVFLLLQRMTGACWRSAFVAAIFALHPLHVESVAWVSERKDVLSTFFWALTIWAYVRYTERPALARYVVVAVLYALGLLAKPMLVTLPCLLLLLDFWPLRRVPQTLRLLGHQVRVAEASASTASVKASPARLVLEKIPLLVLAFLCSAAVLWAQGVAVDFLKRPLLFRVGNAVLSYFLYMIKLAWPARLLVLYPFPEVLPAGELAMAILALILVTFLAVRNALRHPYLFTGWFWFVGTLVPVLGLVQVGFQSMADRYAYVPSIGLTLIIAWGAYDLASRWRIPPVALGCLGVAAIAACVPTTRIQLGYWRNSQVLYEHALRWTSNNFPLEVNLGTYLQVTGQYEAACKHLREAIRLFPNFAQPHYSLGLTLIEQDKLDEAYPELMEALRLKPDSAQTLNNLGLLLVKQGKVDQGIARYREALDADLEIPELHFNLGFALARKGERDEAIEQYEAALRMDPALLVAQFELATVLNEQGNLAEAAAHLTTVLQSTTNAWQAHRLMGLVLAKQGQSTNALKHLSEAARINSTNAAVRLDLGTLLDRMGRPKEAVEQYHTALSLNPRMPVVLNNLAWILASNPDPGLRDGREAVRLAEQACELTDYKGPLLVGTLSVAYAEAGRFDEAIETAGKAEALARAAGNAVLAEKNKNMAELFRSRQPFHETPAATKSMPERSNP